MNEKTKTMLIRLFWFLYIGAIATIFLLAITAVSGCSTTKSNPADWRFHKHTANQHHKIKALKVINCNRE